MTLRREHGLLCRSFGQFGDDSKLVEPFVTSKVHVETPPSRLKVLMIRTYWDRLLNSRWFSSKT